MNDQEFDRMLRQRHAEAVSHLSARTRMQLRNRLAASTAAPQRRVHRVAWAVAAFASLLALVVGLQLRPQPASTPSQATNAIAMVDDSSTEGDTPYAALDENPDLYLWLASNDAVALASE